MSDQRYSAKVEGFFVHEGKHMRLAKTNASEFTLVGPHDIPRGAEGDLLVIVDGVEHSRRVRLTDGATRGQTVVRYEVL